MTKRQSSDNLIITLPQEVVARLRSRGARADRYHGPYNLTQQLSRTLGLYESVVIRSDPRATRGLPEDRYDLILDLLRDSHELETFRIHHLGQYLFETPDFAARAREIGADPAALAAEITAYSFAEKLHLVDAAQIRNAPPRPRDRPR